jgi:16S rRNA C1402 (ribose-2'-O) methylase RsmI
MGKYQKKITVIAFQLFDGFQERQRGAPVFLLVLRRRFAFEGFPPREGKARRRLFRQLVDESRAIVFFEGPHRLLDTLRDLGSILGSDRRIAVCRELTKVHEEIFRGTVGDGDIHVCALGPMP